MAFRMRPPRCQPLFADANLINAAGRRTMAASGGSDLAKVFLSYDREDLAKARSVAGYLEEAGHAVWWDRNIRGGAQYAKEIERALEDSDAVVVLWSNASVNSEWVRDEAAEGRDGGRLIPVLLEPVKPPMGFRQFQAIDVTDWNARPSERAPLLLDALSTDTPKTSRTSAEPKRARAAKAFTWNRKSISALAILALVIAAAGWFLTGRSAAPPTVSVAAADTSTISQALARNLLVKLGVLQASNAHSIKIIEAGGKGADLNFKINGSREGDKVRASIALVSSADGAILWSQHYDQPNSTQSDLEAQIAYSAARVLGCAAEEASGDHGRLSDTGRRTYLNACATLAEIGWDKRSVLPLFRRVLEESPKFRPAWAKLLVAETDVMSFLITGRQPFEKMRNQLREDVIAARKVDPDMAEATLAELELEGRNSVARVITIADKAKAQDPDNPIVLNARSLSLQTVGRMGEAISDAQRAAELDPLSPAHRNAYILALAYGGQIARARDELEEAKKLWPGARTVADAEQSLEVRFGDYVKAVRTGENYGPGSETYIKARGDPSDTNVAAFLDAMRPRPDGGARAIFTLQALGEMGRVDDFFEYAEEVGAHKVIGFDSYALFRPWIAPARRDPRFIRLAKGIGLVDYWQTSGKWPDFCREPDLPYDGKAEAAKLG